MHALHDYIEKQLVERLQARRVVVWYDGRSEFAPFIAELRGGSGNGLAAVTVGGVDTRLAEARGSMFELRAVVEPLVHGDQPEPLLIYLPGQERDRHGSVLMELEKAGECYEPQLKRLARNVLRQRYTDGVIDDLLASDGVGYDDLARALTDTSSSEPPSILKSIFHDVPRHRSLLATWLAEDARDGQIEEKKGIVELRKLLRSRIGLNVPDDAPLGKVRSIALRYVLGGEFKSDLAGGPSAVLDTLPGADTKEASAAVRELALQLRAGFPETYPTLADRVEAELKLGDMAIPAEMLGSIDTFRFEERRLLEHCGDLIAAKVFDKALGIINEREHSFWLDRDLARKAQWEACRRMAELGELADALRPQLSKIGNNPHTWINAYVANDGWFRVDQAQRRLETLLATLDGDANERPLGVVRGLYEDTCRAMADGFTRALAAAHWAVSGPLQQTRIFSEVVSKQPMPVAYFLVDAMRYEMGIELAERLPTTAEVSVRPALCALPSITPIGMAALQPGAAASFSVVAQGGKLGVLIDGAFLPDVSARKKFAAARIPQLADLTLDELLSLQPSKLTKRIEGAQIVIVRSQEIDHAGEHGFTFQARQVMDTVIDNLARGVRRLAAAGVQHAVLSADHGHLFFPSDRDESMRVEAPGGDRVDLHRRCWIGRGGSTPAGCVRVSASALGYESDLDFIFPAGCGVFKTGGDLAFHHGGPSLQELVVPVVTVRTSIEPQKAPGESFVVSGLPDAVTNRIFSIGIVLARKNLSLFANDVVVRPLLISLGKQVGSAGMAIDADFDRATGCIKLSPGKTATIALLLSDDEVQSVRIVLQDPATDADVYRSPKDIPVRLGV